MFKPRLLRETAEIAFTEIKRHLEPKMAEAFSLRRVSTPLYLPAGSPLLDPGKCVEFTLPHSGERMAIVRGLDRWMARQLLRYDIASGFGVFAVMNGIRPETEESTISSPQVDAWVLRQTIDEADSAEELLENAARKMFSLFQGAEERILELFPHLDATLPSKTKVTTPADMQAANPEASPERAEYLYNHTHTDRAVVVLEGDRASLSVWNSTVGRPLLLADFSVLPAFAIPGSSAPVPRSIGATVYRDRLAMQLLHQSSLLDKI